MRQAIEARIDDEKWDVRQAAIEALGRSDDDRVGQLLLTGWQGYTPQARDAVVRAIFARQNRHAALLNAIEEEVVSRGDISAIRREQLIKSQDKEISRRAAKIFDNPAASAELQRRIDQYAKALARPRAIERGQTDRAISVLSDALLRHPGDRELQALMDRALEIRYPQ